MVNDSRSIDRPDHITDDDAPVSPACGIGSHADEALRALYAEHRPALLAYAEGFTGDTGQAEDVVQEAFLCAWRHLPGLLEDERPVRAWLLQVTRRLLIDAARAARARPLLTEGDHSAQPFVGEGLDQLLDQTMLVGQCSAYPRHTGRS
jgi:RNA polymerase sigma-70 factor (ECF subfamily)